MLGAIMLALLSMTGPLHIYGCMTTATGGGTSLSVDSSSSSASSSTTTCSPVQAPCTPPANSLGVISRTSAADPQLDFETSTEVGRCTCSAGLIDTFYAALADSDPYTAPVHSSCRATGDAPNTCVCTEDGQCYRTFGQVNFVLPTVFCDAGGCHAYVVVICTTDADPAAGLINAATGGVAFTCAQQGTRANFVRLGSNSPYLRAQTFSCNGQCLSTTASCPTCAGAFMAGDFNDFVGLGKGNDEVGADATHDQLSRKRYSEAKTLESLWRKDELLISSVSS